jgi:hypothetical protein
LKCRDFAAAIPKAPDGWQGTGKGLKRKKMSDSPETARWFIAELIEELILSGNVRNVVHRKTRVIFADSHEDAYEKALALSTEHETSYLNQKHDSGQTRYWSFHELNLISDEKPAKVEAMKPRPHFRKSDNFTPEQVALLMNERMGGLPN